MPTDYPPDQYGPGKFLSPEHALATGMLSASLMQAGFSVTPVYNDDGVQTNVLIIADDVIPWSFRIVVEGVS